MTKPQRAVDPLANAETVRFPGQRSLTDQMNDVRRFAVQQGMYDACRWIEDNFFGRTWLAHIDGSES